jgi:hypothetical protein
LGRAVRLRSLLLAVPLVLAGCGGGGSTGQNLVSKGDAICRDVSAKIDALKRPVKPSEIAAYVAKGQAIERDGLTRFRQLEAPKPLQAALTAYESAVAQAIALAGQLGAAAAANDGARQQQVQAQAAPLHTASVAAARRIGFKDCSK